ncbi:MAG: hypothetical protein FJW95_05860 [Actinobacteria bacterium]|nr:hypothetical protein [Actinomycetota bacterium]
MTDKTFASLVTPLLTVHLEPGETLRGVVASTYQKTFSGWMVAIGVTERRLILLGLDRKWQPKGPPQIVSDPEALATAELDGAGDGWWTTAAAIADWHSLILRVRTDDGEKTKLTMTRGGMKLMGGAEQEQGVAALAARLAEARS